MPGDGCCHPSPGRRLHFENRADLWLPHPGKIQQKQDQHAELVSLYNLHFVVFAKHSKLHTVSMLCMLVHKCVCSSMSAVVDGAVWVHHIARHAEWLPTSIRAQCFGMKRVSDANHPINKDGPLRWGGASNHCSPCKFKRHSFSCQLHTAAACMVLQKTGSMRTKAMSGNKQRIVAMRVKCFHLSMQYE